MMVLRRLFHGMQLLVPSLTAVFNALHFLVVKFECLLCERRNLLSGLLSAFLCLAT